LEQAQIAGHIVDPFESHAALDSAPDRDSFVSLEIMPGLASQQAQDRIDLLRLAFRRDTVHGAATD